MRLHLCRDDVRQAHLHRRLKLGPDVCHRARLGHPDGTRDGGADERSGQSFGEAFRLPGEVEEATASLGRSLATFRACGGQLGGSETSPGLRALRPLAPNEATEVALSIRASEREQSTQEGLRRRDHHGEETLPGEHSRSSILAVLWLHLDL